MFCLNFWFCLGDWISKSRLLGQKILYVLPRCFSRDCVNLYSCMQCMYLFHTILAIWAYFCTTAFFYISAHSSLATSAYKSTISSGPDEIFCSVCIFVHFFPSISRYTLMTLNLHIYLCSFLVTFKTIVHLLNLGSPKCNEFLL